MKKVLFAIMLIALSFSFLTACKETPTDTQTQDFRGIVFNNQSINYDGEEHTIVATGIPEGASVEYTNAGPSIEISTVIS